MDEMFWKMKRAVKQRDDNKKEKTDSYNNNHKKRLLELAHKRMRIVFAGALDEFEKAFGETLDNNKDMSQKWKIVRNKILNNGNNQSRLLAADIEQYDVAPMRYNYKFTIKPEQGNEESEGNS
jgi:hypothetical protein